MDFNKFPRWALVAIACVFMGTTTFFVNRAVADGDKIKAVAYEARANAKDALELGNELKTQIADVRGAQETFRREYRDDNIRDAEQMQKMEDRIIRAVKTT